MNELHWTPDEIGRLTLPQLVCLMHKSPADGRSLETAADYLAIVEHEAEAERNWDN